MQIARIQALVDGYRIIRYLAQDFFFLLKIEVYSLCRVQTIYTVYSLYTFFSHIHIQFCSICCSIDSRGDRNDSASLNDITRLRQNIHPLLELRFLSWFFFHDQFECTFSFYQSPGTLIKMSAVQVLASHDLAIQFKFQKNLDITKV